MPTTIGIEPLQPFLKWAGGKRWLTARHRDLFPPKFERYIEPFLGGAAVFFSLRPERALLADSNAALIETYGAIKDDWRLVWRYLREHEAVHSKSHYYQARDCKPRSVAKQAALFLYLNRSCWNGLYRVNRKGDFNVPIGTKDTIIFPDDDFGAASEALESASLLTSDFEKVINTASKGDFVFADPPYTINHNMNGFLKYNERIFSWNDQERLRRALGRAAKRGAKIMVTNADHISVRKLYSGFGEMRVLPRHSVLAGSADARKASSELLIRVGF